MENYMDLQVNADHEGDSKTHSPGPWTFELRDDHNTNENKWVIDSEDHGICTLDGPEEYNGANAKLIAAAPDLLEFAKQMASRYPNSLWISDEANKLIKKATS